MIMKEKNKLLQERDLVGEIEKLNMKIVKGLTTKGIRDDEKTYATSEVRMLLDENSKLRSKVAKEKVKRTNAEENLNILEEELLELKLKGE